MIGKRWLPFGPGARGRYVVVEVAEKEGNGRFD
jgi:hypothetical protein